MSIRHEHGDAKEMVGQTNLGHKGETRRGEVVPVVLMELKPRAWLSVFGRGRLVACSWHPEAKQSASRDGEEARDTGGLPGAHYVQKRREESVSRRREWPTV